MKKILVCLFGVFCSINVMAQSGDGDDLDIRAAINAYIAMRDAVAANDSVAIKQSIEYLKSVGTTDFSTLVCEDDAEVSLNGHFVFDEAFADSIAEGKDVYHKSEEMYRSAVQRGQTADGSILTKTGIVKAAGSVRYSFASKGHQELAVVAESGGLLTMKIHVTNSAGYDRRFDDTKKVKKGMPYRKVSFELPIDKRNIVELDVVNCGKKDCSFVIISN